MTDTVGALGPLVIVSGLPAAGKSTLSARLGRDLGFPVVHRDRLRRLIFEGMDELPGAGDLLPAAGDRLVISTVGLVVEAGVGAVLDGNFNTQRHMAPVRAYLESTGQRAIEICLWGDPEELRRRFIERADPPLTEDLKPYFEHVLHRPREAVLGDAARVRHLDTSDVSAVDAEYPQLLDWVSRSI